MAVKGKADHVIQKVAGCGLFQVVAMIGLKLFGGCPAMMTMTFMAFGIYTPTWTCLDDDVNTTVSTMTTTTTLSPFTDDVTLTTRLYENKSFIDLQQHDRAPSLNTTLRDTDPNDWCVAYDACTNVRFDPDYSTIATEWGLVCNHVWVGSVIISIEMAGTLVGSFICGHLGDLIGRKKTLMISQILLAVTNLIAIFATNWQMFAAVYFFAGMSCAGILSLSYVFLTEYSTLKWRGFITAIPVYPLIGCIGVLVSMWLKNWRHIHIVIVTMSVCGAILLLWLPESLRWLEINNKSKQFAKASKQILKVNGKTMPPATVLLIDSEQSSKKSASDDNLTLESMKTKATTSSNSGKTPHLLDLFGRRYILYTLIISFTWMTCSMWFYGLSFGIKSMSGNFFLNAMIMSVIEIPFNFSPMLSMNRVGRKLTFFVHVAMTIVGFLMAAAFSLSPSTDLQTTGVTVLILVAKGCVVGCWIVVMTQTIEIYPTAVRSLAVSWGGLMARAGGIVSPFLIPNDPDSTYICYAVMGGLGLIACLISFKLPETRGKALKETLDQGDEGGGVESEGKKTAACA